MLINLLPEIEPNLITARITKEDGKDVKKHMKNFSIQTKLGHKEQQINSCVVVVQDNLPKSNIIKKEEVNLFESRGYKRFKKKT